MEHIYKDKGANVTLVLFHGTGGDEHDLIPIGEMIDANANIISLRGTVNENGQLRFFKRIKPGVFDENDLKARTHELDKTLSSLSDLYGLAISSMVLVGYSNGANIISSYLSVYGKKAIGAFLLHPMTPYKDTRFPDMTNLPIFISAGRNDPIVSEDDTMNLQTLLEKSGAMLEIYWHHSGHQITNTALKKAISFYDEHIK